MDDFIVDHARNFAGRRNIQRYGSGICICARKARGDYFEKRKGYLPFRQERKFARVARKKIAQANRSTDAGNTDPLNRGASATR
eukprot:720709-Prymnesium_polylepis.1